MKTVCFIDFTTSADYKQPRHVLPSLEIGFAAALLDAKNHRTLFVDSRDQNFSQAYLLDLQERESINLFIVKLHTISTAKQLELLNCLLNKSVQIITIGPTSTLHYSRILSDKSCITASIIGEVELTLLELVNSLPLTTETLSLINGVAYIVNGGIRLTPPRAVIKDLDILPTPKHSFFLKRDHFLQYPVRIYREAKFGFIQATRGCQFKCSFCGYGERSSYDNNIRLRSVDSITKEMSLLKSHGVNVIYFVDDHFICNYQFVKKLCEEIIKKELNISWVIQSRIDTIDSELVSYMKAAGLSTICIGLESGSDRVLSLLNKGINISKLSSQIELLKKHNILMVFFLIIGTPNETKCDIQKTVRFLRKAKPDFIQIHLYTDKTLLGSHKMGEGHTPAELKFFSQVRRKIYLNYIFGTTFLFLFIKRQLIYWVLNKRNKFPLVRDFYKNSLT
jgi:anaerobic magnesium-protoporphyrin IX monomethyl ester cyclase